MWRVYKCNSRNEPHQNHVGDWFRFVLNSLDGTPTRWGTSEIVPALSQLAPGDMILGYQTDRNELVCVAEVSHWAESDGRPYVYLRLDEQVGVKIRPLKADERIAGIHAFKTREIKTLYDITEDDAQYLLSVARHHR